MNFIQDVRLLYGVMLMLALCVLASVYKNLYLHPLSAFPGPFLGRCSLLWRFKSTIAGTFHTDLANLHELYGSVVRVAPNELSFGTAGSWKDIYGFPVQGQSPMLKSNFYKLLRSGFKTGCIGCEQDPTVARRMKANLSPAFSSKALLEQEEIVQGVVNQFVEKVGLEHRSGSKIDMSKWLELVAFDLMGEMTFGESFHCIDTGERHDWIKLILDHVFFVTLADNLRHVKFIGYVGALLAPLLGMAQKKHIAYTRNMVNSRLNDRSQRKDFIHNLISQVRAGVMDLEELSAHSSTLVVAGAETVASSMSGILYWLLRPDSSTNYSRLRQEVRSAYRSYKSINYTSTQQLPYLQAVIKEGLRTFSNGHPLPRVCPGRMIDGQWIPAGAEVYTSPWTVNHSKNYFVRPWSFEPERWLSDSSKSSDYAEDQLWVSQPFQQGPRGCLGRNFAWMEMSLVLAKLVWQYDMCLVNPADDWDQRVRIHVLWWKPELNVRLTQVQITER